MSNDADDLRGGVLQSLPTVSTLLVMGRREKARELLDALTASGIEAIAAGCADPAGLARELAALRAKVRSVQG